MSSGFHNKKSTTASSSSSRGSVMKSALGMKSPGTRLSSFPHSQGKSSNGQGILNQIYVSSSFENMDCYRENNNTAKSFSGFNITQNSTSKHGFRSMSKSNSNLNDLSTNNLSDSSLLSNRNKIKAPPIPFISYTNILEQSKINNEHKSTLMSVVNDQPFSLFSSSQNSKTEALMFSNKVNSNLLEHPKDPAIIAPIKESLEKPIKFDDILTSNVVVPMYETNKKVDANYNENQLQQQQPKLSLADVLSDKNKPLSIFNTTEQQSQQQQQQQILYSSPPPPPQQSQQPKLSLADVLSDKNKPLSIFNTTEQQNQQQQQQQILYSSPPPQQQSQQPKLSLADVLSDKNKPLSIFNTTEQQNQQQQQQQILYSSPPPQQQSQQPKLSLADILSDKNKPLSIFNTTEQQSHHQQQQQPKLSLADVLSDKNKPLSIFNTTEQQQQQPKLSLADVLSDKNKSLSIFSSSEIVEEQQISSTNNSNRNLNSILKSKPTPIYSSSIPLESQPAIPTQININDSSAISLFSFRKNENSLIQLKTNSSTVENDEKHISTIESFDKLFINGDLLKSPTTPSDNSATPSSRNSTPTTATTTTTTPHMLRFPLNPKSSSATLPPGYPQPVKLTPELRKDLGDDEGFF